MISELEAAKARGYIFEYLQLKAKMDHIEVEQVIVKASLEAVMKASGIVEIAAADGKAQIITKNSYGFDVPKIVAVVPAIVSKLKLSNEEYNKILVGNEVALAGCRTVLKTDYPLTISAIKAKKK